MAVAARKGFYPVGHLHGVRSYRTTMYPTRGKNFREIFAGDVVFLGASANRGIDPYHNAASALAKPVLGVVARVYNSDRRPFTFNQPGAGPRIPASTAGFAAVYDDPHVVFAANVSSTANFARIGTLAEVNVCAANTAAGRSGMYLTLAGAVSGVGHVFKVMNILTTEGVLDEVPVSGEVNQEIAGVFVQHQWNDRYGRNEVRVATSGNG